MAVRPFWIESRIDGRSTTMGGGPANKFGGAFTKILQRDKGTASTVAVVKQSSFNKDGKLKLCTKIMTPDGETILEQVTDY